MSDLLGSSKAPVAHNSAQGGAGSVHAFGIGPSVGVALNANLLSNITSDGIRVAESVKSAWMSTVVVQEMNVPTMCQMMFSIGEHWKATEYKKFKPGAKIDIMGDDLTHALPAPVYVSGMRVEGGIGQLMLTVTAFDKMSFLRFGRYTQSFVEMADGEIFRKLLSEPDSGLTLLASELSMDRYPFVLQDNETRYDFLVRRCRQANYECMIEGEGGVEFLTVRACAQGGSSSPILLGYHIDIAELNLDVRLPTLGSKVTSYGYGISTGAVIQGNLSPGLPAEGPGAKPGFDLASAFGPSPVTLRRPDLADVSSLNAAAKAEHDYRQNTLIEGEVTLRNINLKAKAGINVKLEGTDTDFDGVYYVAKSTHRVDRNGARTTLAVKRSEM
jgi:phage protein D